ncbi:leucine-rich repeat-containing protein 53 [Polypterus senegalus]|uniref:leucine-rich repeat-containing protein 53 n=1 Tax=Polypterus senegalus TaxID=55291 RepID=UPI001965BEA8|nr:leucine-rich repeat-containing protein 53 [Polypterus senegalus]
MNSVLIALLILPASAQSARICPDTCVVCSEEVVICQKLLDIIDVPGNNKAIIFTDGFINSINFSNLSYLSNITLLGLSNNNIMQIEDNAFQNFNNLRTLLLDHNLIPSSAILDTTFSSLSSLEILHLSNNALQSVSGRWFKNMRNLTTLQLEGNQITRLDNNSFADSNLQNLKNLDLSNNLIRFIGKDAFVGLRQLNHLDLSRNSLSAMPDAFSYLSWLSFLNLDMNHWNCTCELKELSEFLRSYLKNPNKILYNGKQLICENVKNPAGQTILQLTDANCVAANQNITIIIQRKIQENYVRDIILVATFCFSGALGLMFLIFIFLNYKAKRRKGRWLALNGRLHENEESYESSKATPDCTFTEENGVQILSIMHPGNEAPLLQQNGVGAMTRKAQDSQKGDGNSPTRYHHAQNIPVTEKKRYFACFNCRSVQSVSNGSRALDKWDSVVSRSVPQVTTMPIKPRELAPWAHPERSMPQSILKGNEDYRTKELSRWRRTTGHNDCPCQTKNFTMFEKEESPVYTTPLTCVQELSSKGDVSCAQTDLHSNHFTDEENIYLLPDYLTIDCFHCNTTYKYSRQGSNEERSRPQTAGKRPRNHSSRGTTGMNSSTTEEKVYRKSTGDEYHERETTENPSELRRVKLTQAQKSVSFNLPDSVNECLNSPKSKRRKSSTHDSTKFKQPIGKTKGMSEEVERGVSYSKATKAEKKFYSSTQLTLKPKACLDGLLKVKINLDPFRRNKVYPVQEMWIEEKPILRESMDHDQIKSRKKAKTKQVQEMCEEEKVTLEESVDQDHIKSGKKAKTKQVQEMCEEDKVTLEESMDHDQIKSRKKAKTKQVQKMCEEEKVTLEESVDQDHIKSGKKAKTKKLKEKSATTECAIPVLDQSAALDAPDIRSTGKMKSKSKTERPKTVKDKHKSEPDQTSKNIKDEVMSPSLLQSSNSLQEELHSKSISKKALKQSENARDNITEITSHVSTEPNVNKLPVNTEGRTDKQNSIEFITQSPETKNTEHLSSEQSSDADHRYQKDTTDISDSDKPKSNERLQIIHETKEHIGEGASVNVDCEVLNDIFPPQDLPSADANTMAEQHENNESQKAETPEHKIAVDSEDCQTDPSPEDIAPQLSTHLEDSTEMAELPKLDKTQTQDDISENTPNESITVTEEEPANEVEDAKPEDPTGAAEPCNINALENPVNGHIAQTLLSVTLDSGTSQTQPELEIIATTEEHVNKENLSNNNSTKSLLGLSTQGDTSNTKGFQAETPKVLLIPKVASEKSATDSVLSGVGILQEIDMASGDSSQKKKICLVLPEQSNIKSQHTLNKKIR